MKTTFLCILVFAWPSIFVTTSVAESIIVLRDPPPQPSGGSGVEGRVGVPVWVELHDFVDGAPATPLVQSDPLDRAAKAGSGTPAPVVSFLGVINSPVTIAPPDTHIAVGPGVGTAGRVVMVTNGHVAIWDKSGTVVAAALSLDTMFSTDVFDPKVLFDQHSGRFFIVALEVQAGPPEISRIHIAISSNDAPNILTGDWKFLSGSSATSIGGSRTWADYPGIGADSDSLFVTTNQYTFAAPANFKGMKIRVFDKAALLAGMYGFADIDFDNAVTNVSTTMPANVHGSTTTGGFYLISRISSSIYRWFHITGGPDAPLATTATHSWTAGAHPSDRGADQCTVAKPDIATHSSQVMQAVYRDGHVWCAMTSDPDSDGQTEVVWQDIDTQGVANAPTINQSGFINGTGADQWTYLPSIDVNAAGDTTICYTQSSATECPSVYYTTRLAGDAPGTMRTPIVAKAGPGFYDSFFQSDVDLWGDYSATVVDPDDDCFWVANEFAFSSGVGSSEWGTWIASFCNAECGDDICDDMLFCTGAETCDAELGCVEGASPCSDPQFPVCNEETDTCEALCSYGDVDGSGETDLDDLVCMMEGLSGVFDCLDVVADGLDIAPCGGDGELNLHDLISLLDTLGGAPPCPDGCP